MPKIVLSINGDQKAKIPLDGSQRNMFATIGDYEVHVTVGADVLVSVCHSGMVPCAICGHAKMEVKPGRWACPGFYGSPTHFCDPTMFAMNHMYKRCGGCYEPLADEDMEFGEHEARKRLEAYCKCTLEEYLVARDRLTGELLQEEQNA